MNTKSTGKFRPESTAQPEQQTKLATFSERDTKGKLFIDCAECTRGGNGSDPDKCASGWKVKKGHKGGCFCGTLLSNLVVVDGGVR